MVIAFTLNGTGHRVSRRTYDTRVHGPFQGASGSIRVQEESLWFSSAQLKFTSYAYRCEFGVPCDCSQGMTAGMMVLVSGLQKRCLPIADKLDEE